MADLPPIVARVEADLSKFEADMAELKRQLSDVQSKMDDLAKGVTIPVRADIADAQAKMAQAAAQADALGDKKPTVKVGADTGTAMAKMKAAGDEADALGRKVETIKILVDTSDIDRAKAMIASELSSGAFAAGGGGGGGDGGAPIPGGSVTPDRGGGRGGGAGMAALLAAGFMGKGGGRGIPFTGLSVPALGSVGSLLGLGTTSLLGATAGIGMSAAGGAIGGGLLGLGALGTGAVGAGTNAAGLGQAAGDIKAVTSATTALNDAIVGYGANSQQAATAQGKLNIALQGFNPVAQSAVVAASASMAQFKAMFDSATGQAEKTGAEIIKQAVDVGQKYIPTIGKFASENMNILQRGLQPFFQWLQTTGLGIFTELELKFQGSFPTAIHLVTQLFELFFKTINVASDYIGGFLPKIDQFVSKWNGADFSKWALDIGKLVDLFHTWTAFFVELGRVGVQVFKDFAGTGTAIIQVFTQMLTKLHDYLATAQGATALHAVFEGHKAAIIAVIQALEPLVVVMGKLELTVVPALAQAFAFLVTAITPALQFLASNPFTAFILGLAIVTEKTIGFGKAWALLTGTAGVIRGIGAAMAAWAAETGFIDRARAAVSGFRNSVAETGAAAAVATPEVAAFDAAVQGANGRVFGFAGGTKAAEGEVKNLGTSAEASGGQLGGMSSIIARLGGSGGGGVVALAAALGVAVVGYAGFWKATHTWNDEALVSEQHAQQLGVNVDQLRNAVNGLSQPTDNASQSLGNLREKIKQVSEAAPRLKDDTQSIKDALNGVGPTARNQIPGVDDLRGSVEKYSRAQLQLKDDAANSWRIMAAEASSGGTATKEALVTSLGIGRVEVDRILTEYNITAASEFGVMQIRAANGGKKTVEQLSRELNLGVDQVRKIAGLYNVQLADEQQKSAIIAANGGAETVQQLASRLGLMPETVRQIANAANIKLNDAAEQMIMIGFRAGQQSALQLSHELGMSVNDVLDIGRRLNITFTDQMTLMKIESAQGGQDAVDALGGKLTQGETTLNQIMGAYSHDLAAGLNPLLEAVGAAIIPVVIGGPGGAGGANVAGAHASGTDRIGSGFTTHGPQAIVGEGNAAYPEYVIPTDPAHRGNATALYAALGKHLGGLSGGGCAGGCSGGCAGGACGKAFGGILGFDSGGILPTLSGLLGSPDGGGTGGAGINIPIPPGGFASASDVPPPPSDLLLARGHVPQSFGFDSNSIAVNEFNKVVATVSAAAAKRAAAMAGAGMGGVGPAVTGQCGDWIRQGLALAGGTARMSEACLMARAMNESGCNPGVTNTTDSNAAAGHPSVGLMQFVPSTFAANSVAGCTDLMNPICQVAASAHCDPGNCGHGGYGCKSGGFLDSSLHQMPVHSYDSGGHLPTGASIALNGTGKPEPVGGGTQIHVHAQTNADPYEIGREVGWQMRTLSPIARTIP